MFTPSPTPCLGPCHYVFYIRRSPGDFTCLACSRPVPLQVLLLGSSDHLSICSTLPDPPLGPCQFGSGLRRSPDSFEHLDWISPRPLPVLLLGPWDLLNKWPMSPHSCLTFCLRALVSGNRLILFSCSPSVRLTCLGACFLPLNIHLWLKNKPFKR